ncbi:uncharacterized protein E0L32_003503 [Thyridium curvatum]|uniref:Uncharacterized protein n=1 Tax=Thyridium curvatum TaxID=1093900 RepID=A0A507BIU4_9PEZI|nr:uncharacterized protein E0L32_003503 [Thyridium curvatum]TPX16941.1 hypothetical protein E0L32_003503 [Thyridium curvatum]
MTSKSVQEARFIAAPDAKAPSDSETEGPLLAEFYEHRRREATVYDAVAGNVTTTGALPKDSRHRRRGPGTSGRDPVLAPEEVLFQRRGAPQRYAERDVYFANERDLGPGGDALPDSDLLKAVHAYASDFYEAMAVRSGGGGGGGGGGDHDNSSFFVGSRHVDERSMDETALLAFGILLEEAGREALGRRGDLVFTEGVTLLHHHHHHHHHRDGDSVAQGGGRERGTDAGEQQREEGEGREDDDDEQDYEGRRAMRRRGRGSRGAAAGLVGGGSSSKEVSVGLEGDDFWRRRLPKRRKVAEDRHG